MDMQYEPNYSDVELFIALQVLGFVLFILVMISAIIAQRRGGSRHATFFSFCFSWIVFCLSYALLSFAGQQGVRPEPDHNLCIVHSALVYAAPPLAGSATVSLVTHLLLNIQMALSPSAEKKRSILVSSALVIIPWIIWVAFFVGVLLFAFHHSELVQLSENGTFCVLVDTQLPKLTSVWATIVSVLLVVEEVIICVLLYKNRDALHSFGRSVTMAIRVAVFTFICIGAIAVALVYVVTRQRGVQFDLLIASIPVGAAVIFGSQKDLLHAWMFWKRHEPTVSYGETPNHTDILSTMISSQGNVSFPNGQRRISHMA